MASYSLTDVTTGQKQTDLYSYRKTLEDRFSKIKSFLEAQVKARELAREKRTKLNTDEPNLSPSRASELYAELSNAEREINTAAAAKANELIENLVNLMQERFDEGLDLADPELNSALNIITLAGNSLDVSSRQAIVKQFISKPGALRVIRTALKVKDMPSDAAELDRYIYTPVDIHLQLSLAAQSLAEGGSLNAFAVAVNKVAAKEGLTFPVNVDQGAVDIAFRKGAGLPVE